MIIDKTDMGDTRAAVFTRLVERMDYLAEIGIIGPGEDLMITVEEAAAISCLDVNTIRQYAQNGKIARYKIESSVRFGLREFCEWVSSCRQPSIAERKAEKDKAKVTA
ncbi:MAG: helix-turn-helix domain-containing protein [Treponema sp.]|jgi:hypothetical protein|nr:helix-turn-helix domain-containing protein [Treponema sp.]